MAQLCVLDRTLTPTVKSTASIDNSDSLMHTQRITCEYGTRHRYLAAEQIPVLRRFSFLLLPLQMSEVSTSACPAAGFIAGDELLLLLLLHWMSVSGEGDIRGVAITLHLRPINSQTN